MRTMAVCSKLIPFATGKEFLRTLLPFKGCLAHPLILFKKSCHHILWIPWTMTAFLAWGYSLIHIGVEFPTTSFCWRLVYLRAIFTMKISMKRTTGLYYWVVTRSHSRKHDKNQTNVAKQYCWWLWIRLSLKGLEDIIQITGVKDETGYLHPVGGQGRWETVPILKLSKGLCAISLVGSAQSRAS